MDKDLLKAVNFISNRICNVLLKYNGEDIQEIRLRTEKPLCITICGNPAYLSENGKKVYLKNEALIVKQSDIEETFRSVVEYSVHSFSRELKDGFVTIDGGHRVGICGTAVCGDNGIETIKNISSLNFRIAREYIGSANLIYKEILSEKLCGVLIIGPPSSAKTTVLRDLCRQLANRFALSIVDERSEIASCYHGIPQNDVGIFSDVLDGYPKKYGILMALKVLSPKVIAVDEIGSYDDCMAISESMNSGVKIIATAHAESLEEIKRRKHIWKLCEEGIFDKIVLLGAGNMIGKVLNIYEVNKLAENNRNFNNNGVWFDGGNTDV